MTKKFGEIYVQAGGELICMFIGTALEPKHDWLPDLYLVLHDIAGAPDWEGQIEDMPADWGERED